MLTAIGDKRYDPGAVTLVGIVIMCLVNRQNHAETPSFLFLNNIILKYLAVPWTAMLTMVATVKSICKKVGKAHGRYAYFI